MVNFSLSKIYKNEAVPADNFHTENIFQRQCIIHNLRYEANFLVKNTRNKSNLWIIGYGGLVAKPPEEFFRILRTFCIKNVVKIALGDASLTFEW